MFIPRLYNLRDAIVTTTVINSESKTFGGCVYDQRGRLFKPAQRTSRNVDWKPADPDSIEPTDVLEEVEGSCLYLGHYTRHYGHFLLETLSRFWVFSEDISYDRVIFQPFIHPVPKLSFSPAKICFDCFSIEYTKIMVVGEKTRFDHLLVPNMLMEINNHANEEQALIYQNIVEYCRRHYRLCKSSPSKIYFSRSNLEVHRMKNGPKLVRMIRRAWRSRDLDRGTIRRGHIVNEDEIEKLFISFGFTVIHPEQIPFEEQVLMCSEADVIAGLEGSAMHNSVFMKQGALAITLKSLRSTHIRNQVICDGLAKVRSEFIAFEGRTVDQLLQLGEFDMHYLRRKLESLV